MADGVEWHGEERLAELDQAIGEGLLRGAVYFQTQHKLRLNKSNPRPYAHSSQPGEYPRARSGFGRDNVWYEPTSVAEAGRAGFVRIGYRVNAFYMAILEVYRGRLGLVKTLESIKVQLARIITGGKRS